jgi:hypothetical protein
MKSSNPLKPFVFCWIVLASFACSATAQTAPLKATLVECNKIWSEAKHSAFTSLIRWRDQWYCAFREGENHVGSHGQLRIITSKDGRDWQSAATITDPVYDLRDANLSVTPQGQLMVVGGAQALEGASRKTGTFASYSDDGVTWTEPEMLLPLGRWMWGVTWHKHTAFGVSYAASDDGGRNSLLTSTDGRRFEVFVKDFFVKDNSPNEARLRFATDGTGYCLQRCEGSPRVAFLGTAEPPYRDWKWQPLDRFIGGPNLLELPNKKWIAAGRVYNEKTPKTALMSLNVTQPKVETILELPSGGDCSYPGLVWHEDQLWMSYYSSHEDRTSIYLAVIDITTDDAK